MEIQERLGAYLDNLFINAPKTKASKDLKEELLTNSVDRYNDLTKEGLTEEDAFQKVSGSIGEVDELLAQLVLEESSVWTHEEKMEIRKRTALIKALSVAMYFLAFIILLIGLFFSKTSSSLYVAIIIACVVVIIPTILLIYNSTMYPKYQIKDDSVVEEFKEWNFDSKRKKSIKGSVISLLWILTTIIYLIVSFATSAWHVSWIIFLGGACLQMVINLIFTLKE